MRRAARVDTNQEAIVQALRDAGAGVQSLAPIGKGCPDLLVFFRELHLLEVKHGKGKPNELQQRWHAQWGGPVHIVYTVADALRAIGATA